MKSVGKSVPESNSKDGDRSEGGGVELATAVKRINELDPPVTADVLIDITVFCLAALLSTLVPVKAARTTDTAASVTLTARQQAVLRLAAQGLSNKQIAESLNITVPTVKTHLFWAMEKLGAENRTQAAILASRRRLL